MLAGPTFAQTCYIVEGISAEQNLHPLQGETDPMAKCLLPKPAPVCLK